MLFDLRSRRRRRAVQVVYLTLSLLMLGGLVLFGVGAGNGFGGLLNAFTNNGSGNTTSQVFSAPLTAAEKQVKRDPTSAAAWANLVQQQFAVASEGSNYNSTSNTYSASGKKVLAQMIPAWTKYTSLVKTPDENVAILAARAYEQLGQYAGAADAWELITLSPPAAAKNFECLAFNAYAAKQDRKAELASAKALSLVPKLERTTVKQELTAAKTDSAFAQQC
jgi:hypothetical protein